MTEFKVLGSFEVVNGTRGSTPTAPKLRQILVLLLLHANQVVHIDFLIEELWGDNPPSSAVTTAQTYIYQLRKLIARDRLADPGAELLVTRQTGYLMRLKSEQLDANVFQRLAREGCEHLAKDRPAEAARVLRRALDMWTGPALADIVQGRVLRARVISLEEERLRVLELCIQAELLLGRHRELIGELRSLVTRHPLNEWFHGRLIDALNLAGRRSEALQAYQDIRFILNDELGLEPGPELQRARHRVLTTDLPRMGELRAIGP
jgi:DNA-binding SARP family transcriptional activator